MDMRLDDLCSCNLIMAISFFMKGLCIEWGGVERAKPIPGEHLVDFGVSCAFLIA